MSGSPSHSLTRFLQTPADALGLGHSLIDGCRSAFEKPESVWKGAF